MSIHKHTTVTIVCDCCPKDNQSKAEVSESENNQGWMPEGWGQVHLTLPQKGTRTTDGCVKRGSTSSVTYDACPKCLGSVKDSLWSLRK